MSVSQSSDKAAGQQSTSVVRAWDLPSSYARLHSAFAWQVPAQFNMAQACCARWAAQPGASKNVAVHAFQTASDSTFHTYAGLQDQANRLANVLVGLGVKAGDRVAIVMPQRFETAVAYMAVLQMGAVAMPLSQLFGPEALEFRLQDSAAVVAIGDAQTLGSVQAVRTRCPGLRQVLGVGLDAETQHLADMAYTTALAAASDQFAMVATRADAPAILIYTSGTTGNPKGALIPHRALIGNLTGFLCSQNWFGFDMAGQGEPVESLRQLTNPDQLPTGSKAVFWSPADWAWTGGLMDALLPSLYFGRPIVAFNGRFSPQVALELLRDCGVTHSFLFPTALKAMMKAYPGSAGQSVNQQFGLKLQAIMSAGEAVGDAVFDYCQAQLGVTVNEMFGQTEINYIVGNCAALWPAKPGSMGMGYPGHRLAVIDDNGHECAEGVAGDVAVHRLDIHGQSDPIFFLGYWKNAASTMAKFTGDWCRTGDLASRDAQGYLWYQGRSDDVFKAAGYRIGPGEIENCLVKHPAVANVAVVPKPDAVRGAVVKAYVVLSPDFVTARASFAGSKAQFDAELIEQLQAHVKDKLAPYEYPKEIEFLETLPMTTTGKVQRRVLRLQEEARAQTTV
ncbi:MAG: AMP-binding protein [Betaproteobacteria bacterium HGW-Betaproteobacteria-18]|nr:MAG: AMP-binding protein [Betaproteobacteria bacterium HGW-Betaproteobacteria-18]